MNPPDEKEWRELKELGLKFRIKTPESYVRAVMDGMKAAQSLADGFTSGPWLDTGQIKTLHWVAFHKIFPWAGQFRVSELHGPTEKFTDPDLIRTDLRTLNVESRNWFRSNDPTVLAQELAAYTANFHRIQAFTKGSDLIGRVILSHRGREIFGKHIDLENDLKVFEASLITAAKGKIEPLVAQILEHSPLRREAEIYRIERTIEQAQRELRSREQDFYQSH